MGLLDFLNTWRDNLLPASFRGVAFYILRAETEIGRRSKTWYVPPRRMEGKYWRQNIWPQTVDMGLDADRFTIEGYVIQNKDNNFDYFEERDKLISALKTPGFGKLVHPYYGEIEVLVEGKARIEESFEEGGIARFTMYFVQGRKSVFVELREDYIELVDLSVLDMVNAFLDAFAEGVNKFNALAAYATSLVNDIGNMLNRVTTLVNSVAGAITSLVNGIVNGIMSIVNSLGDLLDTPCELANAIMDAGDSIQGLVGITSDIEFGGVVGGCSGERRGDTTKLTGDSVPNKMGKSAARALVNGADFSEDDLSNTPEENQNNQTQLVNLMQASLLGNACMIGIRTEYNSQQEMMEMAELVADALDVLLGRLDNIDLYNSVMDMRDSFVKSIIEKNSGLAKEIPYRVPTEVTPALLLAYDRYEDLDRDEEIFYRNTPSIHHPGFLPNGKEINILDR